MNLDERIGQLTGMLHETILRMDRFEMRQTQIEQHLVDLISEIRSSSSGAVLLGAMCGAFAGAIAGGIAAVIAVNWMIDLLAPVLR